MGILGMQILFIQYSVKVGRELLRRGLVVVPTLIKFGYLAMYKTFDCVLIGKGCGCHGVVEDSGH